MSEEFGVAAAPELMQFESALASPLYQKLNEISGRMLAAEMDRTLKLLQEHRTSLDAVIEALLAKERLNSEELRGILNRT